MFRFLAMALLVAVAALFGTQSVTAQEGPNLGSITVTVDTNPETDGSPIFDFDGDLGTFDLADDGSQTFPDLEAGSYDVNVEVEAGWELVAIVCSPDDHDEDISDRDAEIMIVTDADVASDIDCRFTFEPTLATATPVPTATATAVPPTQTPVVITQPPTIIRVEVTAIPTAAPRNVIRPPSTGDGGLQGGNPHCAGNSDNINLPSGHKNNFGGCE